MIKEFRGKWRFLSNFHPCFKEGLTVEHFYQAAKAKHKKDMDAILACETPGDAKRLGNKIEMRDDWREVRVDIMYDIVKKKFFTNPELRVKLIETGEQFIQEGNDWNDRFWGVDLSTGEGENMMGKILMTVRNEVKMQLLRMR